MALHELDPDSLPATKGDLREFFEAVGAKIESDGERTRWYLGIVVLALGVILFKLFG